MCTVTLIAQRNGYRLGMNRDEQRARAIGLPPKKRKVRGRLVMAPCEPTGGTWIAVDRSGITLALINWYAITARVRTGSVSRGEIINALIGLNTVDAISDGLDEYPLKHTNPFRLIGVFPKTCEVAEWRWDLKELVRVSHKWKTQQWISSGFNEPGAQCERDRVFLAALRQESFGTVEWLRRLHRNHLPERGPFSTCMHREDAASVSYTEVSVSARGTMMRYHPGSPCKIAKMAICRF